jgi:DNA polymerase-3 subunit alpha
LHVHTEFSLLDGCGSQRAFAERARDLGHGAVAFTDHGSMRGVHAQHRVCEEVGIKPLYGVEVYIAADRFAKELDEEIRIKILDHFPPSKHREMIYQAEVKLGVRPRYHLTLIAENAEGLTNLFRLTSRGFTEGFAFRRPRVDLGLVAEYAEGVVCLSGCPAGPVARELGEGRPRTALKNLDRLRAMFDDRLYIEIMPHASVEGLDKTNRQLAKIARSMALPLVATQDAHYVDSAHWEAHEALLSINTGAPMISPLAFRFTGREYWFKTEAEMRSGFAVQGLAPSEIDEAIASTDEIGARCSATLDVNPFAAHLPEVGINPALRGEFDTWRRKQYSKSADDE